jgi:TolB protein
LVIRFLIFAAAVAIGVSAAAGADPALRYRGLRIYQPVRIALPDFIAASLAEAEMAVSVPRVVASDLKQSLWFELVDRVAYQDKDVSIDVLPEWSDWRRTSTQDLVVGRVTRQSDGRVKVEFRLLNVTSGVQLAGQQYIGKPGDLTGIGHIIAGDIYESLTGEKHTFE